MATSDPETKDPFYWTCEEVTRFFRDGLPQFMLDNRLSGLKLPDTDDLANQLQNNDLEGNDVLLELDRDFLQKELGVGPVKQRLAVVHIVNALRRLSQGYAEHQAPTTRVKLPALPTPHASAPQSPVAVTNIAADTTVVTVNDSEKTNLRDSAIRIGQKEVIVQDQAGKKRRRLTLGPEQTIPLPQTSAPPFADDAVMRDLPLAHINGFLPDEKVLLDDIFYENTPLGQELQQPSEDDDAHDNFDIPGQPIHAGHAAFVQRCMRNMFLNSKTHNITYHRRPAVALYPYPENFIRDPENLIRDKKSRSVTVLQQGEDDAVVKVYREQDLTLSYQKEGTVQVQTDLGDEWSFLLEKYGDNDADVLPGYGESESGEVVTEMDMSSVNRSDDDDDDMAEEDPDMEVSALTKDSITIIVNHTIEQQVQTWRDKKLPKLDKTARSMWRRAKGKRAIVQGLNKYAESKIDQLTTRLETMVDKFLERKWDDEKELQMACEILEPTVFDREYQRWAIRIWARKEEPAREIRNKPADNGRRISSSDLQQPVEPQEDDMQDFIEEDSFEDAQEHVADDELDLDMITQEATPLDPDADENMADLSNTSEESAIEEETEKPQGVDQNLTTGMSSEPPSPTGIQDIDIVHTTPGKLAINFSRADSDDESLPSPSLFTLRLSQKKTLPRKAISIPEKDVVVLSSDPVEPMSPFRLNVTPKKEPKTEQPSFSAQPLNDSVNDILAWDYAVLEDKQDRIRLMLKLVFGLEDEWRRSILSLLTGNITTCFDNVQYALTCLDEGHEEYQGFSDTDAMAIRFASRLFCCWIKIDHSLFSAEPQELSESRSTWNYETAEDFDTELRNWHGCTQKALQKAERYSRSKESRQNVVVIEDDDDDDDEVTPTNKKRKRHIQESQPAVDMRRRAAERAAKYESQHSQTAHFALSGVGDEQHDAVLIYGPDDVDASKHVYLNPHIAGRLKEHQITGVKFMWREITASQDEDDEVEDGQGCLLAHSMGLGKTAQSLALVVTLAETARSDEKRDILPPDLRKIKKKFRVLILCPPSLLQNWMNEIKTWCPQEVSLDVWSLEPSQSKAARFDNLQQWSQHGGILLVGYALFAKFANGKAGFSGDEQKQVQKLLLKKPHLVIADEVHTLRNDGSGVASAASKLKTHRRVGLTGTPMSNNTQEIYSLISWVAPGFLGTKPEFKSNYGEPIEEGTYIDSTRTQIRKSIVKLAALNRIIAPKLDRADITVLKGSLKSKVEFVLTIPLTEEQRCAYAKYVEIILRDKAGEEGTTVTQVKLFGWLAILQLLCNHPKAFREKLLEPKAATSKTKKSKKSAIAAGLAGLAEPESTAAEPSDTPLITGERQSPSAEDGPVLANEHISHFDIDKAMIDQLLAVLPDYDNVALSFKTLLVRQIMDLSKKAGDRVLIFSQSIPSLNFLDKMLTKSGIVFGRIQGDMAQAKREKELLKMQNNELDVLLISTRAGGQGLNIQNANRVIIFDFGFNPTHEEQAVGRAYRLGQTKPVFVYRFVAGGTFEYQLYDKQIFKTGLSSRVVDKKNPVRNANKKPAEWLYPPQPIEQGDIHSEVGKDPNVMDKIIAGHSDGKDSYIRGVKTMETLMTDANDEELTAEEQATVMAEVTNARTRKKTAWESRNILQPPPAFPQAGQSTAGAAAAHVLNALTGFPSTMPPRWPGHHAHAPKAVPVAGGALPPHPSSTAPGFGRFPLQSYGPRTKEAVARQADGTAQRTTGDEMPPPQPDGNDAPSRITGRY